MVEYLLWVCLLLEKSFDIKGCKMRKAVPTLIPCAILQYNDYALISMQYVQAWF